LELRVEEDGNDTKVYFSRAPLQNGIVIAPSKGLA
jgi:hypothetical protein